MAIDAVGAGALGNGLNDFVDAYMKAKNMKDQRSYQQQQMQMEAASKGLMKDDSGNYVANPATQGKLSYETAQYDPSNPVAEQTRGLLKDQVRQVHPDYSEEQLDALVPKGQSAKQYSDSLTQIKPAISGTYMVNSRAPMAAAFERKNDIMQNQGDQRIGLQSQSLGLRTGKVANDLNKQFNGDPVVKATDMQQNSITKGLQQLNSTEKPITNQMLNEIQADYANALTGGRQAAQGTIHDQQMQTLQAKAANLKQYITGAPTEAATPAQVQYFKTAFNELKGLNQGIRQSRVSTLASGATAAYGDQGVFGKVIGNQMQNANGQSLQPAPGLVQNGMLPNAQPQAAPMSRADKEALARKLMSGQ